MPDLPADETLQDLWAALGKNGPENTPIRWQEIDAYKRLTGTDISPEDARTLREMSEAYCGELMDLNPFAIPPMEKGTIDD